MSFLRIRSERLWNDDVTVLLRVEGAYLFIGATAICPTDPSVAYEEEVQPEKVVINLSGVLIHSWTKTVRGAEKAKLGINFSMLGIFLIWGEGKWWPALCGKNLTDFRVHKLRDIAQCRAVN